MNLFKFLLTGICVFILCGLSAQENALWTRYPAISPDGKTIAFNYKGDIYTVNVEGGKATDDKPGIRRLAGMVSGQQNPCLRFQPLG